ncbi:MAG: prephenate dehydrogenase [Christensenellaceae bacterium]
MILDKDKKILIVGLGLIGGSYADSLHSQGYFVGAIDSDEKSISYGIENNLIDEGTTVVSEEFISKYDVIVFALYPNIIVDWIKDNQRYFKKNAVITDVTGIKCAIIYKIQELLRSDLEFIGAHPMAGREFSGVKYASKDIFKQANYIITPTSKNSHGALIIAQRIGELLGFRKISVITPEMHDEMIGFLSQLTHCIAVALMTCKESEHLVDYTGDSFRDLTRIAKINENMWTELFKMNKETLLNQMNLFIDKFEYLKDCIENDDDQALKEMMRLSTKRRSLFDKK